MTRARVQAVLPCWQRLWFPPVLIVVVMAVRIADHAFYRRWVEGELGLIELATPLVALLGCIVGVRLALDLRHAAVPMLLRAWIAVLALACFYLAGEELSWGQQLFHWQTPEAIVAVNDQQETNLHNMSSWFDQKPRLLLELWVLFGGIVLPLIEWRRGTRHAEDSFRYWFWPTLDCLPTAVLAIAIRLPPRVKDLLEWPVLPYEIRYSEPQEYYFALFLLLYLASLSLRTRALVDSTTARGSA